DETGAEAPDILPRLSQRASPSAGAHKTITDFAVSVVVERVDLESKKLVASDVLRVTDKEMTWQFLLSFSLFSLMAQVIEIAPVLWTVLATAALRVNYRLLLMSSNGRASFRQNPWIGCIIVVAILMYFRQTQCSVIQTLFGVFLFSTNAHRTLHSICGRIGLTSAYSTTLRRLHNLGQAAGESLKSAGGDAAKGVRYFLVLYDNVNQYRRPWMESLGIKGVMNNGVAATLVVLEDVPERAFEAEKIRLGRTTRPELTHDRLVEAIDEDHLRDVVATRVFAILVKHVPALSEHSAFIDTLFSTTFARHRMREGRKTEYYPMATSGFDESTTKGNQEVVKDIFLNQLGMKESTFEKLAVICGGDQMTIARLRSLQNVVATDDLAFNRYGWVVPTIQLWHMQWAHLKAIFRCHWFSGGGKGAFGIRSEAERLRRKINPTKCDFYPSHRFLELSFEAHVLDCVRYVNAYQLQHMFSGPFVKATADYILNLARTIERRFMSTEAIYAADGLYDRDPGIYGHPFERPPSNSPSDESGTDGGTQPTSPDFEDDGVSFTTYMDAESIFDEAENFTLEDETGDEFKGDRVHRNAVTFMRDAALYLEFHYAVREGDIGRVVDVLTLLVFVFWGAGSTNYGTELLHLATNFLFDYSEELKIGILNNWLVNPSGLPNNWYAGDLLQEHHNFWIKTIFNGKTADFDSLFLKEAVALNIVSFQSLRESLYSMFGLQKPGRYEAELKISADINALGAQFLSDHIHKFIPARSQPFVVRDAISHGMEVLSGGSLSAFLKKIEISRSMLPK
ncbi:hypothetical protein M407DRAFT_226543, partial [Tulasnella calospora MUT 4182]